MTNLSQVWSEQEISRAAKLWAEGKSGSYIAKQLKRTRNAVLGFMSRNRQHFPKLDKKEAAKGRSVWLARQATKSQGPGIAESLADKTAIEKLPYVERRLASVKAEVIEDPASREERRLAIAFQERAKARRMAPLQLSEQGLPHGWKRGETDYAAYQVPGVEPRRFDEISRFECRFVLAPMMERAGPGTPCCAATVVDGQSWCADHFRLMHARRVA